jgi:hypothetical protein
MNAPATTLFPTANPPLARFPHLITALDAELLGKLAQLTKANLALWHVPAPYDENSQFDNARESVPLSEWAFPLNQAEILGMRWNAAEAIFAGKVMIVDAESDERLLTALASPAVRREETGAYVTPGCEELETIAQFVEQSGWVLIPVGAERSKAFFVTNAAQADLVQKLCAWCERQGRNHAVLQSSESGMVLVETAAPAAERERAMVHHVDAFLSRLEVFFGDCESAVPDLIRRRAKERHEFRERIERARRSPESPA